MARSNNDMDKIMDLFLYIFPKYLNKMDEYTSNREIKRKMPSEKGKNESVVTEAKEKDIKKAMSKIDISEKDIKGTKGNKDNIVKENKSINDGNEESYKESNSIKDQINKKNIVSEEGYKEKSEICNLCIGGIAKILKNLTGEKVDISIADPTMFLLNEVIISNVQDAIVELKTIKNTIVLIPIEEIVGVKANSIYGINFNDNHDANNCEKACKREENLRSYFQSKIGKRIFLQTKGEGEFKYINNRIITGTGKGVVIIEGTMIISLCKIILVEEVI